MEIFSFFSVVHSQCRLNVFEMIHFTQKHTVNFLKTYEMTLYNQCHVVSWHSCGKWSLSHKRKHFIHLIPWQLANFLLLYELLQHNSFKNAISAPGSIFNIFTNTNNVENSMAKINNNSLSQVYYTAVGGKKQLGQNVLFTLLIWLRGEVACL